MTANNIISEFNRLLSYDPSSGVILWKEYRNWCAPAGSVAGTITPDGYRKIKVGGRSYFAHRIAWALIHDHLPEQIDHINRDQDDNRISNLRAVNQFENCRNRSLRQDNKTGVCGVRKRKDTGKWSAQIRVEGRVFALGSYHDFFEAICARKSADNRHNFHPNHGR